MTSTTTFADGALTLAFDAPLAVLTLNRPARRNAIDSAMWQALPLAVATFDARADAAVLVVRGSGDDFAAGADIAEFDRVFADRESALRYGRAMAQATGSLERTRKPTLALIEGHCIGAGVAIALACDIRCASTQARFGVTPARLGLMYSLADTRRLVHAIGESSARDLLFTGRLFGGAEALAMGLVDALHDPSVLDATVHAKAALIAAQSPWSVAHAKAVLELIRRGVADDTDTTRGWFADAVDTAEFKQRLAAFRSRRGEPPPQADSKG